MENYISKIDSERFGYKVAKINDFDDDLKDLIKNLKDFGVKLIISRINSSNIQIINKLEDLGFRLKDTQLLLSHDLSMVNSFIRENSQINAFVLRGSKVQEAEELKKLSEVSFKGYGHYSANTDLPSDKVQEIYADWAYRSCTDKNVADKVIVADVNGKVVGFTSIKYYYKPEDNFSFLNVGAVLKEYRNLGVFRAIIKQCLIESKIDNMVRSERRVLTTNIAVNRSLHDLGFKMNGSEHTFHCWLK